MLTWEKVIKLVLGEPESGEPEPGNRQAYLDNFCANLGVEPVTARDKSHRAEGRSSRDTHF